MNHVTISASKEQSGAAAGALGARIIKDTIAAFGSANIILATGQSQFDMLAFLVADKGIDWSRVTMFHLDEYIGLPVTHRASFRKYLQERFVDHVPPLKKVVLIDGESDAGAECIRLNNELMNCPIAVAFVGIGENGHLAFNDPPADFTIDEPYHIVRLDMACRQQQVNEGWFDSIAEVPPTAISMTIRQILRATTIICSVPGVRKAEAVRNCLSGPVDALFPASILQTHRSCYYFLDEDSARLLDKSKL